MLIQPYPPVRVSSPRGPAEAVAYLGEECYVRLGDGTIFRFMQAECTPLEVPVSASETGNDPEKRNSDAINGSVFGLETAVHAGSKADFGPIRRGDVVTIPGGDRTWRVTDVDGGWASLTEANPPEGRLAWHQISLASGLTQSGDVCPGHSVDIVTRKCVHCGLTDRAIMAAGGRYQRREEGVDVATVLPLAEIPESKPPDWSVDVAHEIGRRPGQMVRVVVGDDGGTDPHYVRVVSAESFKAAFGFDR